MTTLLVASAGGHLTQLHELVSRFRPRIDDRIWVTYESAQGNSLLDGETVVTGHGPSTRSVSKAWRNLRLARRLFRDTEVTRVISTGAGIAVPFLLMARVHGVEAHYVESATRVDGPSLSGRMLESAPARVSLYTQHPTWERAGWDYAGSVFDGLLPDRAPTPSTLRVLVTLGTHRDYPFLLLVERVRNLLAPGDHVVWQLGSTPQLRPLPGDVRRTLSAGEMQQHLRACDVVVAHAGTGIALSAMQAGKRPILVPRRASRREHVDDHQVATAVELDTLGLAFHREVGQLTRTDLTEAARWQMRSDDPAPLPLASVT